MPKVLRLLVVIYAVLLTVLVALAVTVGPFQESFQLWGKSSMLETQLKEAQRARNDLAVENTRLLEAMKKLQTEWNTQQETVQALREMTKNPEMEQRVVEANGQ